MCELRMIQMLFVESPDICLFQFMIHTCQIMNLNVKMVFPVKYIRGTFQKNICKYTQSYLGLGCDFWGNNQCPLSEEWFHCHIIPMNPFRFVISELQRADAMLCFRPLRGPLPSL